MSLRYFAWVVGNQGVQPI